MFVEKISEITNICTVCLSKSFNSFSCFVISPYIFIPSSPLSSLSKTPSHPLQIFNIWSYNSTCFFGHMCAFGWEIVLFCVLRVLYTIVLLFSLERSVEILPFATPWMDLEDSMLNEISQTQKEKYCMVSDFMWNLKKGYMKPQSRQVVTWGGEAGEMGGYLSKDTKLQFTE